MTVPPLVADSEAVRQRVRELSPWYQNIQLGPDIWTKAVDPNAIHPRDDIPAPLWREIAPRLSRLDRKRVLDIGCNAGYMSFECKRLGAHHVLGIDDDSGASTSFIEQAAFCREVLGLDVEFTRCSFFDLPDGARYDVVLFCGVLYHLENWADGLDRVRRLVMPDTGVVVLETAVEPVTQTTYGTGYRGDTTTFFVPSLLVLEALLRERDFDIREIVSLGERGLAFVSAPS